VAASIAGWLAFPNTFDPHRHLLAGERQIAIRDLLLRGEFLKGAIFVWRQLAASTDLAPVIVLLAVCGLAATLALVVADRFTPLLRPLRLPLVNSLAATVNKLSADARRVFRFGPSLGALFACAFGGNLAICLSVYIYAVGLGVDLGLPQWLLVVPLVLLLMALPISLGGWGAREFAMVYLLDLFGVAHADALTVSIGFGLGSMLASLPGAWFWMTLRRASNAQVKRV
jgi:uncharacterized membrane protein YbhN (UPF0104 family)